MENFRTVRVKYLIAGKYHGHIFVACDKGCSDAQVIEQAKRELKRVAKEMPAGKQVYWIA